jgi:hypothetical protein
MDPDRTFQIEPENGAIISLFGLDLISENVAQCRLRHLENWMDFKQNGAHAGGKDG